MGQWRWFRADPLEMCPVGEGTGPEDGLKVGLSGSEQLRVLEEQPVVTHSSVPSGLFRTVQPAFGWWWWGGRTSDLFWGFVVRGESLE